MNLADILKKGFDTVQNKVANTSLLEFNPVAQAAEKISKSTTNTIDDKVVSTVKQYTTPKAIGSGANSLAQSIANGFARIAATPFDNIDRGADYLAGKIKGDKQMSDTAFSKNTADFSMGDNPLGRWIGPIKSYNNQFIEDVQQGDSKTWAGAKTVGNAALDNPFGTGIKTVGFMGSLALKESGPAFKAALKTIAESKSGKQIAEYLAPFVEGGRKSFDSLVGKLIKTDTPQAVEKTILDAVEAKPGTVLDAIKKTPDTSPLGFIETAKNSENILNPVKEKLVSQDLEKATFQSASEQAAKKFAEFKNTDEAINYLNSAEHTAENTALTFKVTSELQKTGQSDKAAQLLTDFAKKSRTAGQANSAIQMLSNMDVDTALVWAQKTLVEAGQGAKFTDDLIKKITSKTNEVLNATSEYEKLFAAAQRDRMVNMLIPASLQKKIASLQTMSLLLNTKTFARNLAGNAIFSGAEKVSKMLASPIDMLFGLKTGERSIVGSGAEQSAAWMAGLVDGLKKGYNEAKEGINLSRSSGKFEVFNDVFKEGSLLSKGERLLGMSLSVPDRAMYQATYESSVVNQIKTYMKNKGLTGDVTDVLKNLDKSTIDKIKEVANYEGLYTTFQDSSSLARGLSAVKKGLNELTGTPDFGLGDIILKFPKTPGNILDRTISYSPLNLMRIVRDFSRAKDLGLDQRKMVQEISRMLTGTTGLMGAGYALSKLGALSTTEKDTDVRNINATAGIKDYQINLSGMKRYLLSGFTDNKSFEKQDGDSLVSYDWAQPIATPFIAGAILSKNSDDITFMTAVDALLSNIDTLGDQSFFRNTTQALKTSNGSLSEFLKILGSKMPATFVPTFLRQIKDSIDTKTREVSSGTMGDKILSEIMNKTPGLSYMLPEKLDTFGSPTENYPSDNQVTRMFNILFNPAYSSEYKKTPEAQLVIDLYNSTGEPGVVPNTPKKKISIINSEGAKEDITLNSDQYFDMKLLTGRLTKRVLGDLANDEGFKDMSDEEKVKVLSNIFSDVGAVAKIIILGNNPKRIDSNLQTLLDSYVEKDHDILKELYRGNKE